MAKFETPTMLVLRNEVRSIAPIAKHNLETSENLLPVAFMLRDHTRPHFDVIAMPALANRDEKDVAFAALDAVCSVVEPDGMIVMVDAWMSIAKTPEEMALTGLIPPSRDPERREGIVFTLYSKGYEEGISYPYERRGDEIIWHAPEGPTRCESKIRYFREANDA